MKKIEVMGSRGAGIKFATLVLCSVKNKIQASYMLINLESILLNNKQTNDKNKTLL